MICQELDGLILKFFSVESTDQTASEIGNFADRSGKKNGIIGVSLLYLSLMLDT